MIILRLDKNSGLNKNDVKAFEHDNLSEAYIIQLLKYGEIYDLTNKTVELTILEKKRKVGNMFNLPIYNVTEGKVELNITSALTRLDGIYDFKLTIRGFNGLIETFPSFQVEIKNDITDSITGEIIQDPNFTILTEGLKALADYNIYKTNALKVPEIEQDIVEINEQLDTITNDFSPSENFDNGIFVIVDDDGVGTYMERWKKVCDNKGVKTSLAINTAYIGGSNLTLEQLKQLKNEGYDILSHCHTHPDLNAIGLTDLEEEFKSSINYLKTNGLGDNLALVYTSGLASITDSNKVLDVKALTRKYFKYGIDDRGNLNDLPFDSYEIKRRNFTFGGDTFASVKQFIDQANTNKNLFVLLTHCGANWDESVATQIIEYVQSINMPIMTFREAMTKVGNVISQGDTRTNSYNFMSKNGAVNNSTTPIIYENVSYGSFDNIMSHYKENKITISEVTASKDTLTGNGGTLVTYNGSNAYSFQIFQPANKQEFFKRAWRDYNSTWGDWRVISPDVIQTTNMDLPISNYNMKAKTIIQVALNYDTVTNTGGVMEIYRGNIDSYSYAIFYPAQSNSVYKRFWNITTSRWSDWQKISVI